MVLEVTFEKKIAISWQSANEFFWLLYQRKFLKIVYQLAKFRFDVLSSKEVIGKNKPRIDS